MPFRDLTLEGAGKDSHPLSRGRGKNEILWARQEPDFFGSEWVRADLGNVQDSDGTWRDRSFSRIQIGPANSGATYAEIVASHYFDVGFNYPQTVSKVANFGLTFDLPAPIGQLKGDGSELVSVAGKEFVVTNIANETIMLGREAKRDVIGIGGELDGGAIRVRLADVTLTGSGNKAVMDILDANDAVIGQAQVGPGNTFTYVDSATGNKILIHVYKTKNGITPNSKSADIAILDEEWILPHNRHLNDAPASDPKLGNWRVSLGGPDVRKAWSNNFDPNSSRVVIYVDDMMLLNGGDTRYFGRQKLNGMPALPPDSIDLMMSDFAFLGITFDDEQQVRSEMGAHAPTINDPTQIAHFKDSKGQAYAVSWNDIDPGHPWLVCTESALDLPPLVKGWVGVDGEVNAQKEIVMMTMESSLDLTVVDANGNNFHHTTSDFVRIRTTDASRIEVNAIHVTDANGHPSQVGDLYVDLHDGTAYAKGSDYYQSVGYELFEGGNQFKLRVNPSNSEIAIDEMAGRFGSPTHPPTDIQTFLYYWNAGGTYQFRTNMGGSMELETTQFGVSGLVTADATWKNDRGSMFEGDASALVLSRNRGTTIPGDYDAKIRYTAVVQPDKQQGELRLPSEEVGVQTHQVEVTEGQGKVSYPFDIWPNLSIIPSPHNGAEYAQMAEKPVANYHIYSDKGTRFLFLQQKYDNKPTNRAYQVELTGLADDKDIKVNATQIPIFGQMMTVRGVYGGALVVDNGVDVYALKNGQPVVKMKDWQEYSDPADPMCQHVAVFGKAADVNAAAALQTDGSLRTLWLVPTADAGKEYGLGDGMQFAVGANQPARAQIGLGERERDYVTLGLSHQKFDGVSMPDGSIQTLEGDCWRVNIEQGAGRGLYPSGRADGNDVWVDPVSQNIYLMPTGIDPTTQERRFYYITQDKSGGQAQFLMNLPTHAGASSFYGFGVIRSRNNSMGGPDASDPIAALIDFGLLDAGNDKVVIQQPFDPGQIGGANLSNLDRGVGINSMSINAVGVSRDATGNYLGVGSMASQTACYSVKDEHAVAGVRRLPFEGSDTETQAYAYNTMGTSIEREAPNSVMALRLGLQDNGTSDYHGDPMLWSLTEQFDAYHGSNPIDNWKRQASTAWFESISPNPVQLSQGTTLNVKFILDTPGIVSADIFDMVGRHVNATPINYGSLQPGEYTMSVNLPGGMASGQYLFQLWKDNQPFYNDGRFAFFQVKR